jgi:hypothetical protein
MIFYVQCELATNGSFKFGGPVEIVAVRAGATEVSREDSIILKDKAQEKWSGCKWQSAQSTSGRYIVRGESSK